MSTKVKMTSILKKEKKKEKCIGKLINVQREMKIYLIQYQCTKCEHYHSV